MTLMQSHSKRPPKLPRTMTYSWLMIQGACPDGGHRFLTEWPHGVAASKEALVRAAEIGLDLEWLAKRVLPRRTLVTLMAKIAPIDSDYTAAVLPIEAEFVAQVALLRATGRLRADYSATWEACSAKRAALYPKPKAQRDSLLIDALWTRYEMEKK